MDSPGARGSLEGTGKRGTCPANTGDPRKITEGCFDPGIWTNSVHPELQGQNGQAWGAHRVLGVNADTSVLRDPVSKRRISAVTCLWWLD